MGSASAWTLGQFFGFGGDDRGFPEFLFERNDYFLHFPVFKQTQEKTPDRQTENTGKKALEKNC